MLFSRFLTTPCANTPVCLVQRQLDMKDLLMRGAFFMDHLVDGMDTRGRPPQFSLALAAKDARLIDDLAAALGIPAPVAAAMRRVFADAVERGLGEHDWSDLVLSAEARAGLDLTLGPAPDAGEGVR